MGFDRDAMLFSIVFFILTNICITRQIQLPENPCKNIFSYREQDGFYFGEVKLPYDGKDELVFSVNLTILGHYDNLNLEIKLVTPLEDIVNSHQMLYRLDFPFQNVLPKITEIQLNGVTYCAGPQEELVYGNTAFWASMTQPLTHLVSSASSFKPQNHIDVPDQQFQGHVEIPTSFHPFKPTTSHYTENPPYHQTEKPTSAPSSSNFFNPINNPFLQKRTTKNPMMNNPYLNNLITMKPSSSSSGHNKESLMKNPLLNGLFKPSHHGGPYSNICGLPGDVNQLVVQGDAIRRGDFPWLAAIFYLSKYICSSTLITDQHVVTAAHCLFKNDRRVKAEQLLFVLGRTDVQILDTREGAFNIIGDKLFIHESYKPRKSHADIAVVRLERSVRFSHYIKPACLWTQSNDLSQIVGNIGTVAGWGLNEDGTNDLSEARKVDLPIVSREECRRSEESFYDLVTENTFCAGARDGKGPCNGDSGSGFVIQQNHKWYLRGVVSLSKRKDDLAASLQCDLDYFVIYTDASQFISWILDAIK